MCGAEQMEVVGHERLNLDSRPLDRRTFRRTDLRLIENRVLAT